MKQANFGLGKYRCSVACGFQTPTMPRFKYFEKRFLFTFAIGFPKNVKPQPVKQTPPMPAADPLDMAKRAAYYTSHCTKGRCVSCKQRHCKIKSLRLQTTIKDVNRWNLEKKSRRSTQQ